MKTISEKFDDTFAIGEYYKNDELIQFTPKEIKSFILQEMTALMKEVNEKIAKNDVWGKNAIINNKDYVRGYKNAISDCVEDNKLTAAKNGLKI